jgi:hypothetical protein
VHARAAVARARARRRHRGRDVGGVDLLDAGDPDRPRQPAGGERLTEVAADAIARVREDAAGRARTPAPSAGGAYLPARPRRARAIGRTRAPKWPSLSLPHRRLPRRPRAPGPYVSARAPPPPGATWCSGGSRLHARCRRRRG